MIKINNLYCKIKDQELLKEINLSINDGEIIGIAGKSGSGKTQLLKCMSGIMKIYSGSISKDDIPVGSIKHGEIYRHFSHYFDYNTKDIVDDSAYNMLLQARKPFKKALSPYSDFDIQIVEEYIKAFGLQEYRENNVLSLSDGIRQKIFIASCFIKKADVLLLDNPTNGLDINSISQLQKAILQYVIDGNKIIVIAANDLNFILQSADRILFMRNGGIAADERPENIDAQIINTYFNEEVLISRNIYNGKPVVHQYLKSEG